MSWYFCWIWAVVKKSAPQKIHGPPTGNVGTFCPKYWSNPENQSPLHPWYWCKNKILTLALIAQNAALPGKTFSIQSRVNATYHIFQWSSDQFASELEYKASRIDEDVVVYQKSLWLYQYPAAHSKCSDRCRLLAAGISLKKEAKSLLWNQVLAKMVPGNLVANNLRLVWLHSRFQLKNINQLRDS